MSDGNSGPQRARVACEAKSPPQERKRVDGAPGLFPTSLNKARWTQQHPRQAGKPEDAGGVMFLYYVF